MKQLIQNHIQTALQDLAEQQQVELPELNKVNVENARDKSHGDYATNVAMMMAKVFKRSPRELAEQLVTALQQQALFQKVDIAGPGFINFTLSNDAKTQVVTTILQQKETFGTSNLGQDRKVILEYVSANPTGPLHVGHGRGTAIGATLANILKSQGYNVYQEYYVNDAGRQMNILAASVYLRYVELFDGQKHAFPENGYKGAYVFDIASKIKDKHKDEFYFGEQFNLKGLPEDDTEAPGKEIYIDAVIGRVKEAIGTDGFATIHAFGLHEVLEDIKNDLSEFGVEFDNYFSEKTLLDDGSIEKGIAALEQANLIYSKEDAVWFKSSEFGDEKDRVLRRSNGDTTYFASDVAYHWNKYDRKFTDMIDVFGADHHGYVPRVKAAAQALGFNDDAINVLLVQFATLYRGQEKISMSTRGGDFVTLRQLREEVGKDAARFFYVLRKSNQHMDFDLELAKSQTNDNPVHYVQYAHARVSSVFDKLETKLQLSFDQAQGEAALAKLDNTHEQQLLNQLQKYPEVLKLAARDKEPHQLAYYLRDLANFFHTYYNDCQFIVDDEHLRNARLCLVKATQQVLKNGLALIGVSAPEQM